MILYSFRFFDFFVTPFLIAPKSLASRGNTYFSPSHPFARYATPNAMITPLKSQLIGVSFMSFLSQCAGYRTRYREVSRVTAIVVTNGPEYPVSVGNTRRRARPRGLTALRHACSERRTAVQNDASEYVLETRYQEQGRVLRVLDVGLFVIHDGRYEPWFSVSCLPCTG